MIHLRCSCITICISVIATTAFPHLYVFHSESLSAMAEKALNTNTTDVVTCSECAGNVFITTEAMQDPVYSFNYIKASITSQKMHLSMIDLFNRNVGLV